MEVNRDLRMALLLLGCLTSCRDESEPRSAPTAVASSASTPMPAASPNTSQTQRDQLHRQVQAAQDEKARLEAESANTKDPATISQLQAKLAAQDRKIATLNDAGVSATPCACMPGDPLCTCK